MAFNFFGYEVVEGSRRPRKKFSLWVAALMLILLTVMAGVFLFVVPTLSKLPSVETATSKNEGVNRKITCGRIKGQKEIVQDGTVIYSFKGIPYAKAPVGNLRWKATQSIAAEGLCWPGVLPADRYGSQCSQYSRSNEEIGSEDCLYLNVWTPAFNSSSNLPVFVYIHGGGLLTGSGEVNGFNELVKTGIVGVSINYRLNAFGFMTLNVFSEVAPDGITSNFGFVDQIEALRWVKKNIRVFGGNPNQVTIGGFSSGGKSVLSLLVSPLANGLFHRVISMSAPTVYKFKQSKAAEDNEIFVNRAKCKKSSTSETLDCLYALSSSDVLKAIPWTEYPSWSYLGYGKLPIKGVHSGALAVIDNKVIPSSPMDLNNLTFTVKAKIPIIFGTETQELEPRNMTRKNISVSEAVLRIRTRLGSFGPTLANDVIRLYKVGQPNTSVIETFITIGTDCRMLCQAQIYARSASRSSQHILYRYVITNHPSKLLRAYGECCYQYSFHGWDTNIIFGFAYFDKVPYTPSSRDLAFAQSLRRDYVNFIKTGRPAQAKWLPYSKSYVEYGNGFTKVHYGSEYHEKQCKLLMENGLYDYGFML